MKNKLIHIFAFIFYFVGLIFTANASAIEGSEQDFLKKYSGQSKEFVEKNLGKPVKVDIAVKPQNADDVLKAHQIGTSTVKKELIEMWYYDANISYAANKYFNFAELTFVNNKCVNITLANKKKQK